MLRSLSVKTICFLFFAVMLLPITAFSTGIEEDIISFSQYGEQTDMEDIHEKAKMVEEKLSPKTLLGEIKSSISDELSKITSVFAGVTAIILLSSLFSCIGESYSQQNHFSYAALILVVLMTLIPVTNCIEFTKATCEKLSTFMLSFIPAISAVSAAGGNVTSASTGAVICSSALSFLEILSHRLLIPASKICVSLCAVSAIGKGSNLSGISSFIKNTCMWISGLIMTVFCGVLSLQTFIGTGADSLAMRGIRFTAAKLIPVAGGMVSESLKTVVAGAGYIKSVAGTAAICYIIYSVMPALCTILSVKLLFYTSSVIAGLSGQKELQEYLNSASNAINLLYAVCALCSISFTVMLAIFIRTTVTV